MKTATRPWQDLFRDHRHALLGQQARSVRNSRVRSLSDEETLLVGGASEAARLADRPKASGPPRAVMLTPDGLQATLESFRAQLHELRAAHPEVEVAGFGPLSASAKERFEGLDRGVFNLGRAGVTFEAASDGVELERLSMPLTAVLIYTPEVTPEAVQAAADAALGIPGLVSLVPLPAGAGDRIPLPGLTTGGSADALVISALRLLLPGTVRVRASWAALGWKVAQVMLAYGADEIAGWTAAESLAYTGRVRAASRVERQELNEGLEEARCTNTGWYEKL